ncbi:MAG: hypothetical protein ACE5IR_24810 [bacterium]
MKQERFNSKIVVPLTLIAVVLLVTAFSRGSVDNPPIILNVLPIGNISVGDAAARKIALPSALTRSFVENESPLYIHVFFGFLEKRSSMGLLGPLTFRP